MPWKKISSLEGGRLARTRLWCVCVMKPEPLVPSCNAKCLVRLSTLGSLVYAYPIERQVAGMLPIVHPPSSPSSSWAPPKCSRRKHLQVSVLYDLSVFFKSHFFKEGYKWHLNVLDYTCSHSSPFEGRQDGSWSEGLATKPDDLILPPSTRWRIIDSWELSSDC